MIPRMNALEEQFALLAFEAQECARFNIRDNYVELIHERFDVDYSRTGWSIDVFVRQWAVHLDWNPEPCPF